MPEAQRRQPQQIRSGETQRRILDATIHMLIEEGYNAIATTRVAKRAQVSQGAVFKHFPTKVVLVACAVERLYDALIEEYETAVANIPQGPTYVRDCIQALCDLFARPRLLAVYDLHTAARTDASLRAILEPKEAAHREKIRHVARRLFPTGTQSPFFDGAISLIINSVQGAAVGNMALAEPEIDAARFETLVYIATQFLELANAE